VTSRRSSPPAPTARTAAGSATPHPASNFWNVFHDRLLERVSEGSSGGIQPTFIHDYIDRHGAHGEVTVEPGAWNTGWHDGTGFTQWIGSQAQRDALTRVAEASQAVQAARQNAITIDARNPIIYRNLEQALQRVLRAETSCNFYWGEAWISRCHSDIDDASRLLEQAWTAEG
jgi:alpha-amylase/alpha-mannosidase (GH57 family)